MTAKRVDLPFAVTGSSLYYFPEWNILFSIKTSNSNPTAVSNEKKRISEPSVGSLMHHHANSYGKTEKGKERLQNEA